jgi:hypothetical protein
MSNRRYRFFLGEPVFKGLFQMEIHLLDTIQRNQACDGNQAFVALGEAGTLPNITEKEISRIPVLWLSSHLSPSFR